MRKRIVTFEIDDRTTSMIMIKEGVEINVPTYDSKIMSIDDYTDLIEGIMVSILPKECYEAFAVYAFKDKIRRRALRGL